MPHVFISYSREDLVKAHAVGGRLSDAQIQTYKDQLLQPGQHWRPELQRNLDASYAVVAICTSASMESREVLFELAYAMGHGIPVIPVRWESRCKLPQFIKAYDYLDFSTMQNWGQLVLTIQQLPTDLVYEQCRRVGLAGIGHGRRLRERAVYIYQVLDSARTDSKLIIVGRSLKEWAAAWEGLQKAINEKRLEAKLALLDEKSLTEVGHQLSSWIDRPLPLDSAITDLRHSMEQFRKIRIEPNTGQLEIYGLPFYASHSFVAYTRDSDGARCYLQEAGMATTNTSRPYISLTAPADSPQNTFGAQLEKMNEGVMTPERLVLSNNGEMREFDTTHRGRLLAETVQGLGLVDLCIQREHQKWFKGDVAKLIDDTPDGGEIFVMGRTLITWSNQHTRLLRAVAERAVRCTFAIADRDRELHSLVKDDPAEKDVIASWENFEHAAEILQGLPQCRGFFQVYSLPVYLPETFGSYENATDKFCILEPGIALGTEERPSMYFIRVSEQGEDVYSRLNRLFKGILVGRRPLIEVGTPRMTVPAR